MHELDFDCELFNVDLVFELACCFGVEFCTVVS